MIDINELRTAAEAAGLNAISMQEVLELLDRLARAEKTNRDWLRANAPGGWIDDLRMKRNDLQAKIEAMERQEIGFRERCTPSSPTGCSNRFPLYALPVAKGE